MGKVFPKVQLPAAEATMDTAAASAPPPAPSVTGGGAPAGGDSPSQRLRRFQSELAKLERDTKNTSLITQGIKGTADVLQNIFREVEQGIQRNEALVYTDKSKTEFTAATVAWSDVLSKAEHPQQGLNTLLGEWETLRDKLIEEAPNELARQELLTWTGQYVRQELPRMFSVAAARSEDIVRTNFMQNIQRMVDAGAGEKEFDERFEEYKDILSPQVFEPGGLLKKVKDAAEQVKVNNTAHAIYSSEGIASMASWVSVNHPERAGHIIAQYQGLENQKTEIQSASINRAVSGILDKYPQSMPDDIDALLTTTYGLSGEALLATKQSIKSEYYVSNIYAVTTADGWQAGYKLAGQGLAKGIINAEQYADADRFITDWKGVQQDRQSQAAAVQQAQQSQAAEDYLSNIYAVTTADGWQAGYKLAGQGLAKGIINAEQYADADRFITDWKGVQQDRQSQVSDQQRQIGARLAMEAMKMYGGNEADSIGFIIEHTTAGSDEQTAALQRLNVLQPMFEAYAERSYNNMLSNAVQIYRSLGLPSKTPSEIRELVRQRIPNYIPNASPDQIEDISKAIIDAVDAPSEAAERSSSAVVFLESYSADASNLESYLRLVDAAREGGAITGELAAEYKSRVKRDVREDYEKELSVQIQPLMEGLGLDIMAYDLGLGPDNVRGGKLWDDDGKAVSFDAGSTWLRLTDSKGNPVKISVRQFWSSFEAGLRVDLNKRAEKGGLPEDIGEYVQVQFAQAVMQLLPGSQAGEVAGSSIPLPGVAAYPGSGSPVVEELSPYASPKERRRLRKTEEDLQGRLEKAGAKSMTVEDAWRAAGLPDPESDRLAVDRFAQPRGWFATAAALSGALPPESARSMSSIEVHNIGLPEVTGLRAIKALGIEADAQTMQAMEAWVQVGDWIEVGNVVVDRLFPSDETSLQKLQDAGHIARYEITPQGAYVQLAPGLNWRPVGLGRGRAVAAPPPVPATANAEAYLQNVYGGGQPPAPQRRARGGVLLPDGTLLTKGTPLALHERPGTDAPMPPGPRLASDARPTLPEPQASDRRSAALVRPAGPIRTPIDEPSPVTPPGVDEMPVTRPGLPAPQPEASPPPMVTQPTPPAPLLQPEVVVGEFVDLKTAGVDTAGTRLFVAGDSATVRPDALTTERPSASHMPGLPVTRDMSGYSVYRQGDVTSPVISTRKTGDDARPTLGVPVGTRIGPSGLSQIVYDVVPLPPPSSWALHERPGTAAPMRAPSGDDFRDAVLREEERREHAYAVRALRAWKSGAMVPYVADMAEYLQQGLIDGSIEDEEAASLVKHYQDRLKNLRPEGRPLAVRHREPQPRDSPGHEFMPTSTIPMGMAGGVESKGDWATEALAARDETTLQRAAGTAFGAASILGRRGRPGLPAPPPEASPPSTGDPIDNLLVEQPEPAQAAPAAGTDGPAGWTDPMGSYPHLFEAYGREGHLQEGSVPRASPLIYPGEAIALHQSAVRARERQAAEAMVAQEPAPDDLKTVAKAIRARHERGDQVPPEIKRIADLAWEEESLREDEQIGMAAWHLNTAYPGYRWWNRKTRRQVAPAKPWPVGRDFVPANYGLVELIKSTEGGPYLSATEDLSPGHTIIGYGQQTLYKRLDSGRVVEDRMVRNTDTITAQQAEEQVQMAAEYWYDLVRRELPDEAINWLNPVQMSALVSVAYNRGVKMLSRDRGMPRAEHVVQDGESLSSIAAGRGQTLQQLHAVNPQIENPDSLRIGQTIILPRKPSKGLVGALEQQDLRAAARAWFPGFNEEAAAFPEDDKEEYHAGLMNRRGAEAVLFFGQRWPTETELADGWGAWKDGAGQSPFAADLRRASLHNANRVVGGHLVRAGDPHLLRVLPSLRQLSSEDTEWVLKAQTGAGIPVRSRYLWITPENGDLPARWRPYLEPNGVRSYDGFMVFMLAAPP